MNTTRRQIHSCEYFTSVFTNSSGQKNSFRNRKAGSCFSWYGCEISLRQQICLIPLDRLITASGSSDGKFSKTAQPKAGSKRSPQSGRTTILHEVRMLLRGSRQTGVIRAAVLQQIRSGCRLRFRVPEIRSLR